MIEQEPWYRAAADQKQREDQESSPTPSRPLDIKVKRRKGWEDDYDDRKTKAPPSPNPTPTEESPVEEKTDGKPDYTELLDKLMRPVIEKAREAEEADRRWKEQMKAREEERQRIEEERRRRGRCPFCGGPPHGLGEIGGDPP